MYHNITFRSKSLRIFVLCFRLEYFTYLCVRLNTYKPTKCDMQRVNKQSAQPPKTIIEHTKQYQDSSVSRCENHYCVGYVFRGRCRIRHKNNIVDVAENQRYVIGRGEHRFEYYIGERGIFEQILIHFNEEPSDFEAAISDKEILRFEQSIIAGIASNQSVEEMAKECCLSISTFKRRFRERYSVSPHKWITERRLEVAQTALTTTNLRIKEVVEVCGYINTSHFISQFKRQYGITPARLRRSRHKAEMEKRASQIEKQRR